MFDKLFSKKKTIFVEIQTIAEIEVPESFDLIKTKDYSEFYDHMIKYDIQDNIKSAIRNSIFLNTSIKDIEFPHMTVRTCKERAK